MNARCMLICGLCLCASITRADTHYVAQAGQTPSGTYTDWSSAASNIQAAIDVASAATLDTVLVSNGVYTLTNQIVITNGITVRGFNGKLNTFVNGNYPTTTNRCFYISHSNAVLDGFTISNGYFYVTNNYTGGGGVYIFTGTVQNCTIFSNYVGGTATSGGGGGVMIYASGLVSNCLIHFNTVLTGPSDGGGGVFMLDWTGPDGITLDNCVISNNNVIGGIRFGGGCLHLGDALNERKS